MSMLNGAKIKELRIIKNLSLRELCKLTDGELSPSHLSFIENGQVGNPTKRVSRALAKALGVKEIELFTFEDHVKGEFCMCKYREEYPTLNGWVYYCDLVAWGKQLSEKELADIGCTTEARKYCKQMMEYTCGVGIVPEPKEER